MANFNIRRGLACFIPALFLFVVESSAQLNILGKPGYIKIPSAQWEKQPSFSFSAGYLPIENTINSSSYFNYDGFYYGFRLGVTDYLELSLNVTYHLEKERIGFGDRQMDARLLLKRETKKWPGVAVIVSLPIESNHLISYNAISLTKSFQVVGKTRLELTGGYGLPYYFGITYKKPLGFHPKKDVQNEYLNGFFGGLSWKPVSWAGIMADYDSRDINAGLWLGYKDILGVQYYLFGLAHTGGNVYLKLPLSFKSRELRRAKKAHLKNQKIK